MTTIDENLAKVTEAGFAPVGHFVLLPKDWENFYEPLLDHLKVLQSQNSTNDVQSLADSLQNEVDVWRECGSSFGYVFYLCRAD